MLLAAQESGQIQPMGIVLIVGFAIILVLAVIYDKKKAGKFKSEIDKMLQDKAVGSFGNFTITSDNKLVTRFDAGTGSGYNIFPLDKVAYIMTARDDAARTWILALYDENKKCIKGEKFDSRKKKASSTKAYMYTKGEDIALRDFVHSHIPQAKVVGKYFKDPKN